MVIGQFNVKGIGTFESKNDPPIGSHCHRPKSLQAAFQRVQAITGKVHGLRRLRSVEPTENVFNVLEQI